MFPHILSDVVQPVCQERKDSKTFVGAARKHVEERGFGQEFLDKVAELIQSDGAEVLMQGSKEDFCCLLILVLGKELQFCQVGHWL